MHRHHASLLAREPSSTFPALAPFQTKQLPFLLLLARSTTVLLYRLIFLPPRHFFLLQRALSNTSPSLSTGPRLVPPASCLSSTFARVYIHARTYVSMSRARVCVCMYTYMYIRSALPRCTCFSHTTTTINFLAGWLNRVDRLTD